MITFSNKTTRENYLYEIEGVRISGDVDFNESNLWASMNIQIGETNGYGNINQDGTVNLNGFKPTELESASSAVNSFITELKSELGF